MSDRPSALFFLPMAVAAGVLFALFVVLRSPAPSNLDSTPDATANPGAASGSEADAAAGPAGPGGAFGLRLFFPDAAGTGLVEEERPAAGPDSGPPGNPAVLAEQVWRALSAGPRGPGRPLALTGNALFFHSGGLLAVRPEAAVPAPPASVWEEAVTLACLVRSLAASVPGVERVQLLPPRTGAAAGHLDLARAYTPAEAAAWLAPPAPGLAAPTP